ncbi:MAG: nuclear transport factor 2 family protein [Gemmatimonadota bacterium]|nr:MAG: nuclear transport factor 2 family protein [Gemmatimonadota bacterium]
MQRVLAAAVAFGIAVAGQAQAQTAADSAGIRGAALDYIEGWYAGDAARMERAVHPELAKRIVVVNPQAGESMLRTMTAEELVGATDAGYGARTPLDVRRTDVRILDIYENVASVRVDAHDWIDYLHIARWNDRWVIVNVLWELTPEAKRRMTAGGG